MDLVSRFLDADIEDRARVAALEGPAQQVLWALAMCAEHLGVTRLAAQDVSVILRDAVGVAVSRQQVSAVLDSATGKVARHQAARRTECQIMKAGVDDVDANEPTVIFVQPEQALSSTRKVEVLLGSLSGKVRLCDPYVDFKTLDLLTE